jgi:hypothetical protein
MKLSTGDEISIKVCWYPKETKYVLNGLEYNSVEELIQEFLFSKYLFTPDFDSMFVLKRIVRIYDVGNLLVRIFPNFFTPKYNVYLRVLRRSLSFEEGETQLVELCKILEKLVAPPQEQECTIYS